MAGERKKTPNQKTLSIVFFFNGSLDFLKLFLGGGWGMSLLLLLKSTNSISYWLVQTWSQKNLLFNFQC